MTKHQLEANTWLVLKILSESVQKNLENQRMKSYTHSLAPTICEASAWKSEMNKTVSEIQKFLGRCKINT